MFGVITCTFLPSLHNGFIDEDDRLFVTANTQVQAGLSWDNLAWAFGNPVAANWHPLTVLSHMADCQIYGLKPWGHHLTNVLLHALTTVLLFLVFRRLTGALWRPAVLAALFGVHPLRVESVAWITERKDVLSALFWMLTLLMYAHFAQQSTLQPGPGGRQRSGGFKPQIAYGLALVFFVCGVMSKPMVVTLPFVLLLLDYWPLNRIGFGVQDLRFKTLLPLLREKLPFFIVSALTSLLALFMQGRADAIAVNLPVGARFANALVSYSRYIGKLFWPENLSVFYPHPQQWSLWKVLTAVMLVLVISGAVLRAARTQRYLAVGWFWFMGTLVPVIGLVQVGSQSMADRYSYLPSIGLLIMVVWGAHQLLVPWRHHRAVLTVASLVAALVCAMLTWRQIGYWKDGEGLWRRALAVTWNNDLIQHNLACALADKGLFDEAIPHYEEAIRMNPARAETHSALAYAFAQTQQLADARRQYEETLRLDPLDAEAHNNLGSLLLKQGRVEEAIQHYREAVRLNETNPDPHANLALAFVSCGRYGEAAAQLQEVLHLRPNDTNARQRLDGVLAAQARLETMVEPYRQALRTNANNPQAHADLGRVLLEAGQVDAALEQYSKAARLQPNSAEVHYQVGATLARRGERDKAAVQFERVLELDDNFAPAHYALGIIRQQQGRLPEALPHWREAARLAPQWPDPLNNLAWALATSSQAGLRDGGEAVKLATRAVELAGTNNAGVLDTLAAAYAEAERFDEASKVAGQAEAIAKAQGAGELARQIGQRRALYASHLPYREEATAK